MPADAYALLIEAARRRGARTILDADGEALERGLAARPDLVKPNRAEAEQLLQRPLDSEEALLAAARALLVRGPGAVALSVGAEGALLVSSGGAWRARPPRPRGLGTAGAGDAMVAAFACSMWKGLSWPEALRLAIAASSDSAGADPAVLHGLMAGVVVEEAGGRPRDGAPAGG